MKALKHTAPSSLCTLTWVTFLGLSAIFLTPSLVNAQDRCSQPTTKRVRVQVVKPESGSGAGNPVPVQLKVVEPRGCDATFYIAIDGRPYFLVEDDPRLNHGPNNPRSLKPLPTSFEAARACLSTEALFARVVVAPGFHTFSLVDECPQGSAVPATVPVSVDFEVVGAGKLPTTGAPDAAVLVSVVGVSLLLIGFILIRRV